MYSDVILMKIFRIESAVDSRGDEAKVRDITDG